jgi:hypothetical protein
MIHDSFNWQLRGEAEARREPSLISLSAGGAE